MTRLLEQVKVLLVTLVVVVFFVGAVLEREADHSRAEAANGESAGTSTAVSTGYKLDRQTALFRTAVSGADATLIDAAFLSAAHFVANGRENIPVSARFSNAGANCVVRWVCIAKDPGTSTNFVTGISGPITLTASAITVTGGKYLAPTYVFDSYGASDGMLMVISVSAGTVDFAVGSY